MDPYLVLSPRLSEKAYTLSKRHRTYVFDVPVSCNRYMVAQAVASQFGVKVTDVNIAVIKGKAKRTVYKRGKAQAGREATTKKAYVTIAEGEHLPIFDAEDEATKKQEATQEKMTKLAEKQAEKETKSARRGLRVKKEAA